MQNRSDTQEQSAKKRIWPIILLIILLAAAAIAAVLWFGLRGNSGKTGPQPTDTVADVTYGTDETDAPATPDGTPSSTEVSSSAPETGVPEATVTEGPAGTPEPTEIITSGPSEAPSDEPSEAPSEEPTENVTSVPTKTPTATPAVTPTPTKGPTPTPTSAVITDITAYSGLVISKVYGNGGIKDAACEHSFIELYNATGKTVDLNGLSLYYKSADGENFTEFKLPAQKLGAGKYYLIRGKASAGYQNAYRVISIDSYDATWDVSLNNKEIRLALAPSGKNFPKNVPVAELTGIISYFAASDSYYFDTGYVDDYNKNKVAVRTALKADSGYYLENLTKALSSKLTQIMPVTSSGKTGTLIGSKVNEVVFSQPAGFYTGSFKLKLSMPSGYTKIYYTKDGSDPKTSSTRYLYTGDITLTDTTSTSFGKTYITGLSYVGNIRSNTAQMIGAHVIKAYATNDAGTVSTAVYTNTYFVSSKMAEYGVSVMSLSIDTNQIFGDPGFYHNFNASSNDPNTRGTGFMEVFDRNGERYGYSYVELAISGHGSSGTGMRSMKVFYKAADNTDPGTDSKLHFDLFDGYATNAKGQNITEFARLLLRNSGNDCGVSYIRDAYMQRVSRELNIDTMAYAPVLLFINGDFWGLYNARERYSGDYVESHYGIDKDNVALIESDYSQVHTNQNAPFVVSSGLDNDADDFNNLVTYMKNTNLATASNYEYVAGKIDIPSFIDMYVSRLYFSARDWPENNIKVWRNRASNDPSGFDNKWHFTLLDMDMGISFFTDANNTTENSNFFGWCDATGCVVGNMMHALLKNANFKKMFLARFYQVLNEVYIPSEMVAELEALVDERTAAFPLQTARWGASSAAYSTSVANMKKFVNNRYRYAVNYLCSYFGISESYLKSISGNYIGVEFSDVRMSLKIDGESVTNSWVKKFDSSVTLRVEATPTAKYTVEAVLFTDSTGKVTRYAGASAAITTSKAGTISFETKKIASGETQAVQSGLFAGGLQMFYLTEDGRLYAWGSNADNVLGAGADVANVLRPTLVKENVAQISVCQSNDNENNNNSIVAAILTKDGEIMTIGANIGSLGRASGGSGWGYVDFDGNPVSVSVGYDHLLILDDTGTMWGIGNNSYGQLGTVNAGGSATELQKVATNVKMISAGRRNSAWIDNSGRCYVLGDARWNKFRSSTDNITTPYLLLSNVSYISSGEHEMILVDEEGRLYYAGWRSINGFGQGNGTAGAAQLSISDVSKASIHFGNMIILTERGEAYVYGINTGNAIGGTYTSGVPHKLVSSGVKDVAAGYDFIAYQLEDGSIKITGGNAYGQGGNGSTSEYVSSTVTIK